MFISKEQKLTFSPHFLEPGNASHRQYEALRAYFVEGLSSAQAAARFGYTPGSFRSLVHQFRQNPQRSFFGPINREAQQTQRQQDRIQRVVTLRKQNLSIYDISQAFLDEGQTLIPVAVDNILKQQGFARLPRRLDSERPPGTRPTNGDTANVKALDLQPRHFRTQFGGLFLFLPDLVACNLDRLLGRAGFPGSDMIPAGQAVRSLLALKLFGNARHSHIMSHVLDEGLALFAGLNVIPKRSFFTSSSCRIPPTCHPKLIHAWFDAVRHRGLRLGSSFDLDFHTIPFHGQDALVEKHYISKRSRRQKDLLAFLAQAAHSRVFCYVNADLRQDQYNDEILRFVAYWKKRTRRLPDELIFDSRLTTYSPPTKLNHRNIHFITLRRRSANLLRDIAQPPAPALRRLAPDPRSPKYRTPRILPH